MNPLQIFEKHPEADAYRVGGFYSPYALVSTEKRFTDAELAAEYWRAWVDMLDVPEDERYSYEPARIATLRKFATLPHFDA
jgi:hypothetical protein